MDQKLRVLIVDDTVTYRKIVSAILSELPYVEVVGVAANGKIALQKAEQLRPDLLLLDLEMPEIGGVEVLRRLKASSPQTGVIMLSAFTVEGAATTVTCLNLGAFDFILKPSGPSIDDNIVQLRRNLEPRLAAYARKRDLQLILGSTGIAAARGEDTSPPDATLQNRPPHRSVSRPAAIPEILTIGVSTGGPQALTEMLPRLPADLPVPVLIVQHMPPVFTKSLADDLDRRCPLRVCEAQDGQEVRMGEVLIAPGGKQMKVCCDGGLVLTRITDDPPQNSCRPSVDYLLQSIAAVYGGSSLTLIMTGMGSDGTAGCRLLKQCAGKIIAQDEASCVVFGMPRLLVAEGIADVVAPLGCLASEIVRIVGDGSRVGCR